MGSSRSCYYQSTGGGDGVNRGEYSSSDMKMDNEFYKNIPHDEDDVDDRMAGAPGAATGGHRSKEQSLNEVTLIGRVGAKPILREGQYSTMVTFSLATHERYRNPEDSQVMSSTTWHNIVVKRRGLQNFMIDYVDKGSRLLIKGSIKYYLKRDPNPRDDMENYPRKVSIIVADNAINLSNPNRNKNNYE